MSQYQIDEVSDFVDGGRKQLKVSTRANPVVVYGGTWKLHLDDGMAWVTRKLLAGEMSGKEMGVFLHLVEDMGATNLVVLNQKALAQRLACSVSYVSRVLAKLKALDLLRGIMINPTVVVKCRTEDYPPMLANWNRLAVDDSQTLEFGTKS